jgi:spermidine synthase
VKLVIASIAVVAAAVCGYLFQDRPYRLRAVFQPCDQAALDHRDSPYSNITWVASPSDNFLQLRFFDRVEGGACLRPSWDDLIALAATKPSLTHLVPAGDAKPVLKPGPMWPFSWTPNPGALSNSAYIRLFPASVLLNQRLMTAAGGDPHAAKPRILVVGLGSGIGIATLAYHFPNAAITVVDIDQVVVDMVRDHFPLLHWLAGQHLADGTPRLRFEVRDARQFIRYDGARDAAAGRPYDVIVLDAYTSGSTIPPHLMTREFYAQCAAALEADGVVMANVIGCYAQDPGNPSNKHLVLGGAIRSFRAAGLSQVWNFPVMTFEDPGHFDPTRQRNNIVIASRKALDPKGNAAGWQRLRDFSPYPELPAGAYVSSSYVLIDSPNKRYVTAAVPAALVDQVDPGLRGRMTKARSSPEGTQYPLYWESTERGEIDKLARIVADLVAKGTLAEPPKGWDEAGSATTLRRYETDWVLAAQETYRVSISTARDGSMHSGEALVGDLPEGPQRDAVTRPNWMIADAPLFTDQKPNADIFNN